MIPFHKIWCPDRLCAAWCAAFCFAVLCFSATSACAAMPDGEFAALCLSGTAEQVRQALKDGANANAYSKHDTAHDSTPALSLAARSFNGSTDKIAALLAAGADINAREERYGMTALMDAASGNRLEVATLLLSEGADVHVHDAFFGQTALFWAAGGGHVEMIKMLLKAGAKVDARSQKGSTALMVAACYGQVVAVGALLAAGADPALRDTNGDALWYARHPSEGDNREGAVACARLLEEAAAKR
ncbi:MAG: ankyrin repeat domain-containing protein [Deltaproteobacteria bacterium]|nr:ankyrin repeat domain-containing protein [Deltaproteobacteria bacterium]